jgi:hypothetical protein
VHKLLKKKITCAFLTGFSKKNLSSAMYCSLFSLNSSQSVPTLEYALLAILWATNPGLLESSNKKI